MVIPWKNDTQQLVSEWNERLHELEREIDAQPDDRWLWLLQVRVRILTYLVSRYADSVIRPPTRQPPRTETATPRAIVIDDDADRRTHLDAVRPQIRQHLESLEETNAERYARLPAAAPLPLRNANVNASSSVEVTCLALLLWLAIPTAFVGLLLIAWALVRLSWGA